MRKVLVGEGRQHLADVLGVDQANVWRWETGKASPHGPQLLRLLHHYREHRSYLLDGSAGEQDALPEEHAAVLREFLATKTGARARKEGIAAVLSSIQFPRTPTVQLYRVIALELLADSESER